MLQIYLGDPTFTCILDLAFNLFETQHLFKTQHLVEKILLSIENIGVCDVMLIFT